MGPDYSHALSAEQMTAAWIAWVQLQMGTPPVTGGG
jgi:hypothetical protein